MNTGSLVPLEIRTSLEAFAAQAAAMRPLTGMCVQVFSEMCALFEPLSAHCAWVPPVAAVDAKDVGLDVGVSGEQFEANTTRVLVAHVHSLKLLVHVVFLEVVCL